ncbi:carbohydrate-binding protein [Flammeovirga sp. SJP92]|uniref:carbohydrate-binding protein n=1 Tax=Flammeovirga sp. SJP92 TaxID=1775430 RepID=UPI000788EFB8|nr:carbohydrate-binding protein [Flammeovirga sp. SJP92]KXX71295.1 hypothetical protein AVL50_09580 [Flammeovirga sp. SJP92]
MNTFLALVKRKKNWNSIFRVVLQSITFLFFSTLTFAQQVQVSSLAELNPYLSQDDVDVKLAPGVYNITAQDIVDGKFSDYSVIDSRLNYVLFLFSGNNSTYDFTGVTVNVETAVFNAYPGSYSDFYEVQTLGNNNVIKNLTLVDVGSVDDYPKNGACNIVMDGSGNRIEGFHTTAKGSFPYGYGDAFGKGGSYTIKHYKHSSCLIRGESNHVKGCTFIHRTYGHCVFMQAANNAKIEDCYIEGEVRSTDDMLAEEGTGSPADNIDFLTDWGYRLPPGYMLSTGEAGIRAYNAGETIIDGVEYSRGTSNVTVLNCTVKHMRTGVTIAHATGTKYVEGVTAIGCENGFSLGSGDVVDCYADCAFGPVYASTYENDNSYNAEITIIPAEDPYYNGSGSVAYIGGSNHKITLKGGDANLAEDLTIKVGGDKNNIRLLYGNLPHQNDFKGSNFELNNLTNYPVLLSDKSENITGQSGGMVTDLGVNNNLTYTAVSALAIEAVDYAEMSGVTKTASYVTDITADDWMEYTIDVPYSGTYLMDYSVASASENGAFIVTHSSETIDQVTFPATGGAEIWNTVRSTSSFFLEKGEQTIRITSNSSDWNFQGMDLLLECAQVDIVPYVEELNVLGTRLSLSETNEIDVFPGNTVKLLPEPTVGGSWSWTGPNGFSADTREIQISAIQAENAGEYEVTFTNDCGVEDKMVFTINVEDSYVIQAQNFSNSNGVETEVTSDDQGESNVTAIHTSDWMEYEINVPVSATYKIDYRVLSASNDGDFTVSLDGESLENVTFSSSASWQTVTTATPFYLTEGMHTIKVTSNSEDWKLNWIELKGESFVNPCTLPFTHDGFTIRNEDKMWSSGLMDISCVNSVNVYAVFEAMGAMTASDQLNIYYKLDGGEKVQLLEETGDLENNTVVLKDISGQTIEILIEGVSTSEDNYYEFTKINIVETTDPFQKIEAEDFDDQSGVKVGNNGDVDGGQNLGSITPGSWSMYAGLDLTEVKSIDLRLATIFNDAFVEIRLGSPEGRLVGKAFATNTNGWQVYETVSAHIEDVTGIYDVYLVYQTVSSSYVVNVNWLQFSDQFVKPVINPFERFEAEYFDEESGAEVVETTDVDGSEDVVIGSTNGDYIKFDRLDITGVEQVEMRVANPNTACTIEVRLNSPEGKIISFIDVPSTGSLSDWTTVSAPVDAVFDENSIYFVFKEEQEVAVNWLQFKGTENSLGYLQTQDYDDSGLEKALISSITSDAEGGEQDLRNIVSGDWIMFSAVDLTGINSINTRFGSLSDDAFIEIRTDASDGNLIGQIDLHNTGSWHNWETVSGNIEVEDGVYDLYFVYKTVNSSNVCNSNWFQLSEQTIAHPYGPLERIEAESYTRANGTSTTATTDEDGGELEVTSISQGNWLLFQNVDLSNAVSLDTRIASASDNVTIDVYVDAYDGEKLTTVEVPNTGGLSNWETVKTLLDGNGKEGIHHIYLVFNGEGEDLVNINWLQFSDLTEIVLLDQKITFPVFLQDYKVGDENIQLSATTDSGLPITYSSSDESVATIVDGDMVQINGAGEAYITASQEGNNKYKPATNLSRKLVVISDDVTSIDDLLGEISFYPNPASEWLVIKTKEFKNVAIEIVNLNGLAVHSQNINQGESQINISTLNSGMYILKVVGNDKVLMTSKFIKR